MTKHPATYDLVITDGIAPDPATAAILANLKFREHPMSNRYYIVWCPTSTTPPKHRHNTYAEAHAEAKRLAQRLPGSEFVVLGAMSSAKLRDPVEVTSFSGSLTVPPEPAESDPYAEIPFCEIPF